MAGLGNQTAATSGPKCGHLAVCSVERVASRARRTAVVTSSLCASECGLLTTDPTLVVCMNWPWYGLLLDITTPQCDADPLHAPGGSISLVLLYSINTVCIVKARASLNPGGQWIMGDLHSHSSTNLSYVGGSIANDIRQRMNPDTVGCRNLSIGWQIQRLGYSARIVTFRAGQWASTHLLPTQIYACAYR